MNHSFKDFCVFLFKMRSELHSKLVKDENHNAYFVADESIETSLTVARAFLRANGVPPEKAFDFLAKCSDEATERKQK